MQLRKYTYQQYALAELMLTNGGFSYSAIARVTRMSVDMVEKIGRGLIYVEVGMNDYFYDKEDNEDE